MARNARKAENSRMRFLRPAHSVVEGTTRIEAYSDAVLAIIITIIVLELHVPELHGDSATEVFTALWGILPQFVAFAVSFLTISVFWVNHHHFFHELKRTDGRFLWLNNALLFWLSLVPFTTGFAIDHPFSRGVLVVYSFVLFFAALSFFFLTCYAMFGGNLLHAEIDTKEKKSQVRHNLVGVLGYAAATLIAPFFPWVSLIIMFAIPVYYIAPRLLHSHEEE